MITLLFWTGTQREVVLKESNEKWLVDIKYLGLLHDIAGFVKNY